MALEPAAQAGESCVLGPLGGRWRSSRPAAMLESSSARRYGLTGDRGPRSPAHGPGFPSSAAHPRPEPMATPNRRAAASLIARTRLGHRLLWQHNHGETAESDPSAWPLCARYWRWNQKSLTSPPAGRHGGTAIKQCDRPTPVTEPVLNPSRQYWEMVLAHRCDAQPPLFDDERGGDLHHQQPQACLPGIVTVTASQPVVNAFGGSSESRLSKALPRP